MMVAIDLSLLDAAVFVHFAIVILTLHSRLAYCITLLGHTFIIIFYSVKIIMLMLTVSTITHSFHKKIGNSGKQKQLTVVDKTTIRRHNCICLLKTLIISTQRDNCVKGSELFHILATIIVLAVEKC